MLQDRLFLGCYGSTTSSKFDEFKNSSIYVFFFITVGKYSPNCYRSIDLGGIIVVHTNMAVTSHTTQK